MRVTETVETGAGAVTVRELTVGEIRQWLAGLATRASEAEVDVVGELLIEGFALSDLPLFVGASLPATESDAALTQSELRAIFEAARRLNADFFGLRDRLLQAGMATPAIAPAGLSTPSNAPPSS
jgi:hypothetical protein